MPASGVLDTIDPVPCVPKPDALLEAQGVRKQFGGLLAVDVDSLQVQRGTITALIGPNGAGKSTFFNVLSGFDRADGGTWSFGGSQISGMRAHRIARLGMVRTFQLTKALARMSVLDNMKLGAPNQVGERILPSLFPGRWRAQEAEIEEHALELLERFRLIDHRDHYAGTLSGGQRKLLEMARALMARPVMLLLDEPMAGVNPALVESLLDHIREISASGTTVLFVEHDMDVVMGISDWVVCMGLGRVIAEGRPAHVGSDPAVVDAYLGTSHDEPGWHVPADDAEAQEDGDS
ncbi:MAG: ABC transporter ATP-binding protein [Gaiellales bacterium]